MGLIVGDEASRMITRAKHALVDGYDLYALGKLVRARERISEAADCAHNARLWIRAELQVAAGDAVAARSTLDGLIELGK